MKYTQNFNMKIPEGGDPIDISDITGNFETLDEELSKKASSSGGDISSMTVKTLDAIATEFPVPSAGESSKTFLGKVKKFIQDFNDFKTGILTLGRLVNNGQTTEPGFALDARYGKTLYDLYAQLNANLDWKIYRNVNNIGLSYDCTMDQIIGSLSTEVDAILITPIFKEDYPNLMLASSSQRHMLKVECPALGYVAITDYDITNGVCYFTTHDGINYKPWTSSKPI